MMKFFHRLWLVIDRNIKDAPVLYEICLHLVDRSASLNRIASFNRVSAVTSNERHPVSVNYLCLTNIIQSNASKSELFA